MHILLVHMIKFKFLTQFPVDHLPHPVISSFIIIIINYLFIYSFIYLFLFILLLLTLDIIIISLLANFLHQFHLVVFHWSLSDSKSPQVSRTLLSIRSDLNNAEIWIVLILFFFYFQLLLAF